MNYSAYSIFTPWIGVKVTSRKKGEGDYIQWVFRKGLLHYLWKIPSMSHEWKSAGSREDPFHTQDPIPARPDTRI